jgi:hypothetical protein
MMNKKCDGKMTDVKKEVKKLYKDALYFHLIHNGYTMKRAELAVGRIFNTE